MTISGEQGPPGPKGEPAPPSGIQAPPEPVKIGGICNSVPRANCIVASGSEEERQAVKENDDFLQRRSTTTATRISRAGPGLVIPHVISRLAHLDGMHEAVEADRQITQLLFIGCRVKPRRFPRRDQVGKIIAVPAQIKEIVMINCVFDDMFLHFMLRNPLSRVHLHRCQMEMPLFTLTQQRSANQVEQLNLTDNRIRTTLGGFDVGSSGGFIVGNFINCDPVEEPAKKKSKSS